MIPEDAGWETGINGAVGVQEEVIGEDDGDNFKSFPGVNEYLIELWADRGIDEVSDAMIVQLQ